MRSLTLPIGVQLANHDICGVTDDRAEDTGDITAQETHSSLGQLAILLLGLTHGFVDNLNSLLKGREFGHGVGNLARPQGIQSLVEAAETLLRDNATPTLAEVIRERRKGGLHADLDGFHRAQGHIGEELGRGTGAQEDEGAVGLREHLVAVQVLEVFIQTVLAGALERVPQEGGRPAEEDAAEALLGEDRAPCGDVGGVDLRVDLSAALDQVERCYSGVSWP